jgi:hypothetical protein
MPEIVKKNLVSGWIQQVGAHVQAGASEGGFDRENAHMTRTAVTLDEKGFNAIAKELGRALEKIEKIAADSTERVKSGKADGEDFRATAVMMLFEGPSVTAGLPEDAGIKRHKRRRAKTAA